MNRNEEAENNGFRERKLSRNFRVFKGKKEDILKNRNRYIQKMYKYYEAFHTTKCRKIGEED